MSPIDISSESRIAPLISNKTPQGDSLVSSSSGAFGKSTLNFAAKMAERTNFLLPFDPSSAHSPSTPDHFEPIDPAWQKPEMSSIALNSFTFTYVPDVTSTSEEGSTNEKSSD